MLMTSLLQTVQHEEVLGLTHALRSHTHPRDRRDASRIVLLIALLKLLQQANGS
jgi:hypothetical protein